MRGGDAFALPSYAAAQRIAESPIRFEPVEREPYAYTMEGIA